MSQDGIKTSEIPKEEDRQSSTDSKDQGVEALMPREWKINLIDFLLCPKCHQGPMRASVNMCSNGHSVCLTCRTSSDKCPLCDADFIKGKNPMLSKLTNLIKYPCVNASIGCPVHYHLKDEMKHLRTCANSVTTEHRCKIDPCPWVGKKADLLAHVQSQHKGGTDVEMTGDLTINQDHFYEEVKLIVMTYDLFWMLTKSDPDEKKLYKCFQYIGPPGCAKLFHYQIRLRSSSGRLQVTFWSQVDDDTRDRDSAYESEHCAVVDFATLQTLRSCSPDNKINYNYEVAKKPNSFRN